MKSRDYDIPKTIEVLVATVGQTDCVELYKKMNIQTDCVIANQCSDNSYEEHFVDNNKVKVINSTTIGVGINRNFALLGATADILLFSDDDLVYTDGYYQKVLDAFIMMPKADAIIFGIEFTKNGEHEFERIPPNKRLHIYESMKYGTAVLAIRRSSLIKKRISFSHLFGGGCRYSSGEDSLFLLDCFRKRMKVFGNPYVLVNSNDDYSCWFNGFNEKYYYDKGAWISAAFPTCKIGMIMFLAFRIRENTEIRFSQRLKLMKNGSTGYNKLEEYKKRQSDE